MPYERCRNHKPAGSAPVCVNCHEDIERWNRIAIIAKVLAHQDKTGMWLGLIFFALVWLHINL